MWGSARRLGSLAKTVMAHGLKDGQLNLNQGENDLAAMVALTPD
jgi:hypothetical protein